MAKRHCVFQVGLVIVLVLLSCAQGRAQKADCDPSAPVKVQGGTTTIGPVTFTDHCKFRFVFHALELDNLTCASPNTLTVTASAVSASTVQGILNANNVPGTPIIYNEFKKPIVYTLTQSGTCSLLNPTSPPTYTMTIFANFPATNVRLGRNSSTGFTFGIAQYAPFGTDPVDDTPPGTSDFFLFDLAVGAAFPGANTAPATFCGFSPPLQPTLDLSNVPRFNVSKQGRTLNWRFQLVPLGNLCTGSSTNVVAGAVALLSVAQYDFSCPGCSITSPKFVGFVTIQGGGGGTFNPANPAIFSSNTGSYNFVQDVSNLPAGFLYIGTVVLLSNNLASSESSAFILQ